LHKLARKVQTLSFPSLRPAFAFSFPIFSCDCFIFAIPCWLHTKTDMSRTENVGQAVKYDRSPFFWWDAAGFAADQRRTGGGGIAGVGGCWEMDMGRKEWRNLDFHPFFALISSLPFSDSSFSLPPDIAQNGTATRTSQSMHITMPGCCDWPPTRIRAGGGC